MRLRSCQPDRLYSYSLLAGLVRTQPEPGRKRIVAELGNLTVCIVLRLRRLSTVKIRAGSLFRTPSARIGATRAAFRTTEPLFPRPSTGRPHGSQDVHRRRRFRACAKPAFGCKVEDAQSEREEFLLRWMFCPRGLRR